VQLKEVALIQYFYHSHIIVVQKIDLRISFAKLRYTYSNRALLILIFLSLICVLKEATIILVIYKK
jgi:hypothetical protein